jgi:hypothetical protein
MIVFSCTLISTILYAGFRNKINDGIHFTPSLLNNVDHTTKSHQQHSILKTMKIIDYSIAIVEIVNLCLLALSLCTTIWALIKIRKLNYRRTSTRE